MAKRKKGRRTPEEEREFDERTEWIRAEIERRRLAIEKRRQNTSSN